MRVHAYFIGKTAAAYLKEGTAIYEKRLERYLPFSVEIIPDVKRGGKMTPDKLREAEAEAILSRLRPADGLILLDERGKQYGSVEFAHWLDGQLQRPYDRLILLVGGAYGFSPAIYERANEKLGLSKMTFSHQMIRLFLLEQLYRGMTILKNEPYHNEG